MQPAKVVTRKNLVSNQEAGATEADGCSFLYGKTDGLGGGAEGPGPLRKSGSTVAAKIELGASLIV